MNNKSDLPSLVDLLALSHIYNSIGSGCGTLIGALVTIWHHDLSVSAVPVILAALATTLVSSAGFLINDICDVAIDRINRPDRPLPAGRVSVRFAWGLYISYNVLGILLALAVSPVLTLVTAITIAALFLYSYWLKRKLIIGHLIIASLGAFCLPYGGLAVGSLMPTAYTMPVVFCAFFAREILKTVPDVEGDRLNKVVSIPMRFGSLFAVRFSQVIMLICAAALLTVKVFWPLNTWYLVMIIALIWPMLFVAIFGAMKRPEAPDNVQRLLRLSKLLFLLSATAFLIGSLPY
jgi:geranylgeranylglycerol-phosphate geranylgeranyltransferase